MTTFAIVPAAAYQDRRLSLTDHKVLGAIATFAGKDRTCFPHRKTIGEACNIRSLSLISKAIGRLIRFGYLVVIHRAGSSLYRILHPGESSAPRTAPQAVHPVLHTEQTSGTDQLPPSPQESQIQLDLEPEPTPSQPAAPAADPTPADATPQPENAAAVDSEPTTAPAAPEVTEQDVVQAIIAHFFLTTGVDCDRPRHRKAIAKALQNNTQDEITRAASYCASNWSNRSWATPAAVCKPGRIDEVLSQAKATAAPRQAAHRPFEPEAPIERAAPATVARHLAGLKAALAGRATPS